MSNFIERHKMNKRTFNIHSTDDVNEFEYFMQNKRWKDACPFHLDWPYVSVVEMIKDQIVHQFLKMEKTKDKKFSFDELEKAMGGSDIFNSKKFNFNELQKVM